VTALVIKSPNGDVTLKKSARRAGRTSSTRKFDVVLLSCKAIRFSTMRSSRFAPGGRTADGDHPAAQRHAPSRRPRREIRQGPCPWRPCAALRSRSTSTAMSVQLTPVFQSLTFGGARRHPVEPRPRHRRGFLRRAISVRRRAKTSCRDMWEKWVLLATIASSTSLMRAPAGRPYPGGARRTRFHARRSGRMQRPSRRRRILCAARGASDPPHRNADDRGIAADRVDVPRHQGGRACRGPITLSGDMIARADAAKVPVPKLRTAYTHLKAYEQQRG